MVEFELSGGGLRIRGYSGATSRELPLNSYRNGEVPPL